MAFCRGVRRIFLLPAAVACLLLLPLAASAAENGAIEGRVFCDSNGNQQIDLDSDQALPGVDVLAEDAGVFSATTDADGRYHLPLPFDDYTLTLDPSTLPADASIVQPPSGMYMVSLTPEQDSALRRWLVDSETCREEARACWMTAGGTKFESLVGDDLAQHGPRNSFGGNVFPGCNPDAGEGGQWNHIDHALKLHFQGWAVQTVACGNVPGIDPGSESPVTPFNYIEFMGTGTLTGIQGNPFPQTAVHFFARVEDRNEPGNEGPADGEDVDRYFLQVFSDPADPAGTTLLLADVDGDPTTLDPLTITGGNLQLHISSCEDPP